MSHLIGSTHVVIPVKTGIQHGRHFHRPMPLDPRLREDDD